MSFYNCDGCEEPLCEECWDCAYGCDTEPACECEVEEDDRSEMAQMKRDGRWP